MRPQIKSDARRLRSAGGINIDTETGILGEKRNITSVYPTQIPHRNEPGPRGEKPAFIHLRYDMVLAATNQNKTQKVRMFSEKYLQTLFRGITTTVAQLSKRFFLFRQVLALQS